MEHTVPLRGIGSDESRRLAGLSGITAWLWIAVAGFVVVCAGVVVEVYRHEHGTEAHELISTGSPGALVAFGGLALAAAGVLMALSISVLRGADTPGDVMRRGAGVAAALVIVAAVGAGSTTYVATSDLTLTHGGHDAATSTGQPLALSGSLTLDGSPLDAQFLGAYVIRDGMITSCQTSLPGVIDGRYAIAVASEEQAAGCGVAGADVVLWTSVGDAFLFARAALPWPEDGAAAPFDTAFSTSDAEGASAPHTPFGGELVRDRDGSAVAAGTLLEAYIGDVLCGVASIRRGGDYTLLVAGPQVEGCTEGGEIGFLIGGEPATQTAINDLRLSGERESFELRVE